MSRRNVRITTAKFGIGDAFDSEGRRHKDGAVVDLSEADAALFAERGWCEFLTAGNYAEAVAAGKEAQYAAAQARAVSQAKSTSAVYDAMPPEWRARVREEGDGVIEEYLASLPSMPLDAYLAKPTDAFSPPPTAPKGRRRKSPAPEGGDA